MLMILDVILVSYNYFWVTIVLIWYIHVLQCYKFRPCKPNFQENTNSNKKNYKKCFSPKSFWNYYIGVISLNQTWSDPLPTAQDMHGLML